MEGEDQGKYCTGWWARDRPTANLKKKLNIEKRGAIGGLDLPEGRELKEEGKEIKHKNISSLNLTAYHILSDVIAWLEQENALINSEKANVWSRIGIDGQAHIFRRSCWLPIKR